MALIQIDVDDREVLDALGKLARRAGDLSPALAAVQQFGVRKGSLGKRAPWGDIPARQFLGVNAQDASGVLDIIEEHLMCRSSDLI